MSLRGSPSKSAGLVLMTYRDLIKAVLRRVNIRELLDQDPEGGAFFHARKSSRCR
ncbi:Hypothetical protein PMT_2514 [Prochlorococcus marinus str. MIT 9313]|uniref:Uncharacterized protein n=1 Tax=Prochlorococcus marinus (strain MIT 9313) TaxID=74547 RepID=B9ERT2_PROMM|nr:Hypothetical protein PMT_2514 [Prochlorococcus marinus str. MIT 9313]